PKLFHSHLSFLGNIADTLVAAGHDVVFYMPTYDSSIRSNGTKFARTIEYRCELPVPYERSELFGNIWAQGIGETTEAFYWLGRLSKIEFGACEHQLSDNNLVNRLRDENFDVAINDATALCGYALIMKIGVKKLVSAMPISLTEKFIEPFAITVNPSHVPVALSRSTDLMGFWERVYNVIGFIVISSFAETVTMPATVQLLRKYFGPGIDSTYALNVAAQSTFLLTNGNE
uniref:glucuronosyltransferase n=1 Tax=Parascaris univalens TaxID=6257 RepID=A0A915C666_PARUN